MPPTETKLSAKIEIRNSAIHGRGCYAIAPIKKGEIVVEWGGEYVDRQAAEKAKSLGKLVMQWDEDLFSVEDRGEDEGYFINHSCDSNLWMSGPYTLIARTDIDEGQELTADYALWEANQDYVSSWECKCGLPGCRTRVSGKDWQRSDVQQRYKGHFSPLIEARG